MRATVATLALILACSTAGPQAFAAKPAPTAVKTPDFTGVWVYRFSERKPPPKADFTPEIAKVMATRQAARPKDYVRSAGNMLCLPNGGPSLFTIRSPFEIMQGFGRISFIFETEGSNQPRTVYMNEKAQPENIYPSFNGHSIGHWEGKTLVVDTVGFVPRGQFAGNVPKTETSHLVEHFNWSPDGRVMTATITVTDPATLTQPYTYDLIFDRMPATEERFEVWCEPDLDSFRALDLNKLKDADPEVARILDPNLRPTDPALKIAQDAASATKP